MRFFGHDESGLAGLPELWLSTWMRPWGMFGHWNTLWGGWTGTWQRWLESAAAMPAAWMPALAEERQGQPESIAFFLPWLPRIETKILPPDHGDDDAVRVMLRATLPGGLGGGGLEVDATVRRYRAGVATPKKEDAGLALSAEGDEETAKLAKRGERRAGKG